MTDSVVKKTQDLILAPGLQPRLELLAERGYPEERCGLLLGRVKAEVTWVEQIREARNTDSNPRKRYNAHPDDILRAENRAQELGLDVVGIWHSHPDHPAVPSETDLESAWPGYSYIIVSVSGGESDALRSWRLEDGKFVEERIMT